MRSIPGCSGAIFESDVLQERPSALKVHFDGGRRSGQAGFGWVIFASFDRNDDIHMEWAKIGSGYGHVGDESIVAAELRGAFEAINAAITWLHRFG